MAIYPERPQTIGAVLDTTFQLYKASLPKVWPMCLLMAAVSLPPSIYMTMKGPIGDPMAALALMSDRTYWLLYVASILLVMWVAAGLYIRQHGVGVGEDPGASAALQAAAKRTLPLVLMWILFMIAVTIGLVLLVVPGLILMVSLLFGANLLLLENKGPVDSLVGSHRLVWGAWWRTTAILTVGFIIVVVLYMAVGFVVGAAAPFLAADPAKLLAYTMVSTIVLGVLMSLLLTPFYVAMLLATFWDLKLRKEGGDLMARVDALNAA